MGKSLRMYIYEIRNLVNNKRYIGQTIQFIEKRWRDHRRLLNNGKHRNVHLQNAWNKYGPLSFKFSILHTCSTLDELNKLEEKLIKENINGYNLKLGGDNGGKCSDKMKLRMSLAQRKVDRSSWDLQSMGKRLHTKKAKIARQKAKIPGGEYPLVVSPNGKIYHLNNAAQFCRKYSIKNPALFREMMAGLYTHCYGWRLATKDTIGIPFQFFKVELISPNGDIYIIENLTKFCKQHNLAVGNMSSVIHGKRHHCGGWKVKQ